MSTIEDLADHIASSIASNKLEQLTTLLAHPLAQDVMRINSGSRLRLACVKNRLDFIDVLVEYCGDQEIGGALHFCLTNLRLKSFDRIVQHKPHSGAYMAVTTLDLLLDLHTTRLKTFESPFRLQALLWAVYKNHQQCVDVLFDVSDVDVVWRIANGQRTHMGQDGLEYFEQRMMARAQHAKLTQEVESAGGMRGARKL